MKPLQRLILSAVIALLLVGPFIRQTQAQGIVFPSQGYGVAFMPFHEGDYLRAGRSFRASGRSAMRVVNGRYVDSICNFTMIGECLYQMGENQKALDSFNEAVKLAVVYSNWMLRVRYPRFNEIRPLSANSAMRKINWGNSNRNPVFARINDKMLTPVVSRPRLLAGGNGKVLVAPPELYNLGVRQICEALALAIRRRTEILGPLGEHDPLTDQLIQALSRRAAPQNHWVQSWISVHLGLAYQTAGKIPQAMAELNRGLRLGARWDHQLTATALLEMGKMALASENFKMAMQYSYEATFSAVPYAQYHVMDEALRTAMVAHMVSGQQGVYPPLLSIPRWANRESRMLQVGALISAAENAAAISNTKLAATLISQAGSLIAKRNMGAGRMGARYRYVAALVNYQQGNMATGQKFLNRFLSFQQGSSRRLFQSTMAAKFYADNTLKSMRTAQDLFDVVLREPTSKDWSFEPMESLSVINSPNMQAMQYWFEVNLQAKNVKKAMEITDRIRRYRFYATLPMAGRLLSFRWILDAPVEALNQVSLMQRMDLLSRYPKYREISRQSKLVREKIRQITRKAADEQSAKQLQTLFGQQAQLAAGRERILHELALRREPSEFIFPPQRSMQDIQREIKDDQAVFTYFIAGRYVYAFAFSKEKQAAWRIQAPNQLKQQIKIMLREMGNFDRNTAISVEQLTSDKWKQPAQRLLNELTQQPKAEFWNKYRELIIVPDGVLWYVPFSALQVQEKDESLSPLISKVRVRMAPTLGLIQLDDRKHHRNSINAVVMGSLFPRADSEMEASEQTRIRKALPDSLAFRQQLPLSSSFLSTVCDRVVVMADIDERGRGAYAWSPMQLDKGKAGSQLSTWFALPWGRTEQIVLPGYHTPAESALKRGGAGNEIFLSVLGMMSTGTRTVAMSRWRTGGQANHDLIRELVLELPHTSPSEALQRSIHLVRRNNLEPEFEPRLRSVKDDVSLSADHPLFWANMMLVDVSGSPKRVKRPAPVPGRAPATNNPAKKKGKMPAFPKLPGFNKKGKPNNAAFPALPGAKGKGKAKKAPARTLKKKRKARKKL